MRSGRRASSTVVSAPGTEESLHLLGSGSPSNASYRLAVGIFEAVKGFRRLKGCADMPKLVAALRARDQQCGLVIAEENVA